jgi:hypothetical protein
MLRGCVIGVFVIEYVIRTHVFAYFFHVWSGRCRCDFGGRGKIMDLNINETQVDFFGSQKTDELQLKNQILFLFLKK